MSQLAKLLTAEDPEKLVDAQAASKPRSDAIAAILSSAGVEYTHENSEVIGSSKVEAQLSRRAERAAGGRRAQIRKGTAPSLWIARRTMFRVPAMAEAITYIIIRPSM